MLPQKRRISKTEFPRDLRGGKRSAGIYFSATFFPTKKGEQTKYAVVVSGKVSKKAVIRNKIRRRAYAVIEKNGTRVRAGYLVIFFARAEACGATAKDIERDMGEILRRADMLV